MQVFEGLAARGKTSVDWFFGFKLHIVVNVTLTPDHLDDRKPVPDLLRELFSKIFGVSKAYRSDRGDVSEKFASHLLE